MRRRPTCQGRHRYRSRRCDSLLRPRKDPEPRTSRTMSGQTERRCHEQRCARRRSDQTNSGVCTSTRTSPLLALVRTSLGVPNRWPHPCMRQQQAACRAAANGGHHDWFPSGDMASAFRRGGRVSRLHDRGRTYDCPGTGGNDARRHRPDPSGGVRRRPNLQAPGRHQRLTGCLPS